MLTHTLILNARDYSVPQVVHAVYGDTARELSIMLADTSLTGATEASVWFTRADGTYYYEDGTINGNTVTVPMEQMLTCVGDTHCNLNVTLADGTVQTFEFVVAVHVSNGGAPATEQEAISLKELDEKKQDSLAGYAEASLQTGTSTAGAKGWYIKRYTDVGTVEQIELCDANGDYPAVQLFTIGDMLSCKAGFSANYVWEVTDIVEEIDNKWYLECTRTDNIPTPTPAAPFDPSTHLYTDENKGYIWNPEKPSIGTVKIGYGAMAIGSDNKANEWGSLAIGDENEVDGRYAFANGQKNKVSYGSAAIGHENKAYSYDGLAVGMKNETKNYRASAFGFQNKMYAANGFAAGVGNEATKAARSGINIRGSYAIVQNNDTFIDVVGGGSDADHRANASALTPAGNLRIKGDIFVKCNSDSSGGTNLRTALDAKEDKGTFVKVDEVTISEDIYGDFRYDMPAEYKCVMIWLSLPRPVAETFRVFTASANNQNGIEITTTAGSSGNVCNVKIKFDCTHGILEAEGSYTSTQNYGGYVTKRCYASYENEPVLMTSVGTIIIRNTAASPNNIIRTGTKMKIYGY